MCLIFVVVVVASTFVSQAMVVIQQQLPCHYQQGQARVVYLLAGTCVVKSGLISLHERPSTVD